MLSVSVHPTLFPEAQRADLLSSLRARIVNSKFHYGTWKQTLKWLKIHQEFSPAQTDLDTKSLYSRAAAAYTSSGDKGEWQIIGLGCGGGQKDLDLIQALISAGSKVEYFPIDVGMGMVITANDLIRKRFPAIKTHPIMADLEKAADLQNSWGRGEGRRRIITCYGLMPNFEPDQFTQRLAQWLSPDDELLISANLSPGDDYQAGIQNVLPLYDNAPTREWLMLFLQDHGLSLENGRLIFSIEPGQAGLLRIVTWFEITRPTSIEVQGEFFHFEEGERVRLFFSYRHTPELLGRILGANGIQIKTQWIAKSGEEGVFRCRRV